MVYKYQCDIDKQNCNDIYPQGLTAYPYDPVTVFFNNQSCVRDQRLEGNVGRCGFPGASCIVNVSTSNCATGLAEICLAGTCQGAPGYPCATNNFCNWGVRCNVTFDNGICGGSGAYMANAEAADGLDFGRDYCASGIAIQNSQGYWICSSGPTSIVPNATYAPAWPKSAANFFFDPISKQPTPTILGGTVGGFAFLLLLLALLLRKKDAWGATDKRIVPTPSVRNSEIEGNERHQDMPLQSQRGWISHILLFISLEVAYMTLVTIACIQPVVLSVDNSIKAKGVTTLVSIAWQTIALLPIRDIASSIFSSEWSHSFWRTRELIPGQTDSVSVQTAGFLVRSKHFFTSDSSWAFRLAFPLSLLSVALAAIAPGALSVTLVFVPSVVRIDVGSIDITQIGGITRGGGYGEAIIQRSGLFARVEQVEGGQYGFRIAEPGVIVGCPRLSSITVTSGNLTYPSDIVRFNHECRWTAPTLAGKGTFGWSVSTYGRWVVDGKTSKEEWWTTIGAPAGLFATTGIFPLEQTSGDATVSRTSSSGISAWLFIGSNSSFTGEPVKGSPFYPLDLGDVPASYNNTPGWTVAEPSDIPRWGAPLASVLLCDPKLELSSTFVTYTTVNNSLSISSEALRSSVGNISPASAGVVLAQSLLGGTSIDPDYTDPSLSVLSASIFLQKPLDRYYSFDHKEYVRSVANISSTIGPYVSSGIKAWSDGFYSNGNFSTVSVDAIQDHPELALVGNIPLTITTGILILIMFGLAVVQLWLPIGEPLGIASITKALELQKPQT